MIWGRTITPIQPREMPAATGTQRGASSQKTRCTIASAAPIHTTPRIENCQAPLSTSRPYGV